MPHRPIRTRQLVAVAESGDVARDVRSREPRVRDAREDTLARILSLSEGLPRDARDAVERAVAVARGASDLQLILEDLAGAAAHALRDEAYWRGEAGTAAAANDGHVVLGVRRVGGVGGVERRV
jgi:hypothetical protein